MSILDLQDMKVASETRNAAPPGSRASKGCGNTGGGGGGTTQSNVSLLLCILVL